MASSIRYIPSRKKEVIDFLENSDSGDAMVYDFDTGNRGYMLQLIKKGNVAYGYYVCKWYFRRGPQKPFVKIAKDYIQWIVKYRKDPEKPLFDEGIMGNWQDKVKAFFRSGLFPQYGQYYREQEPNSFKRYGHHTFQGYSLTKNQVEEEKASAKRKEQTVMGYYKPYGGKGVGLRYLRQAQLVNFSGTEIPMFTYCKFSWEGELISRVPKEAQEITNAALKTDKDTINRNNRMGYANTKIVRKLKEAKETDDWSKLNVEEIFTLRNVTHRTELINHFGMETILNKLDHSILDKNDVNGNKYELLSVVIPDTTPGAMEGASANGNYLKMMNPTTDEIHIEGVANETSNWGGKRIDTVLAALAWRDGEINDLNDGPSYNIPQIIT